MKLDPERGEVINKEPMQRVLLGLACASLFAMTPAIAGYWYTDIEVYGIGTCPADIFDSGDYLEATIHFPDGTLHHVDGHRDSRGRIQWETIRD